MELITVLSMQIFVLLSSVCRLSLSSTQTQDTSIFSFGDSFTDTGNLGIIYGAALFLIGKPPYRMTFFRRPNGRASDGRLAIDFIAEALGLPLLPPSLAANQSFNFAVAGATALNRTFYVNDGDTGVTVTPYNISISVQLGWFGAVKASLCSSPHLASFKFNSCKELLAQALFFVGALGWKDYAVMLIAGKSVGDARSRVPDIVGTICAATEKLIDEGAKTVLVSGMAPLGCAPANLQLLANLTGRGELVRARGGHGVRRRHPGVRLTYADIFVRLACTFGLIHGPFIPPETNRSRIREGLPASITFCELGCK